MLVYTFRFDDVSLNTDTEKLQKMIAFLHSTFRPEQLQIILAVSPAVYNMDNCEKTLDRERAFPSIWHTESDYRIFYKMQRVGVPALASSLTGIRRASHGMAHVDHRLLDRSAQELSIVMSCALVKCDMFVPPFHKWNKDTEAICYDHNIDLLKFNHTWRHLAYRPFDHRNPNYYVHTHDFHYQDFCARFTPEGLGVKLS